MSISNNNPCNLVYVEANKWQGLADPPFKGRFCSFLTPVWGIRAACMNLIAYQNRHEANTITKIISLWAPVSENDTNAYIADVVGRSGFAADQPLNLHTYEHLKPLVVAMVWHENGEQPYSPAQFDEALKLAGVIKPPPAWVKNPKVLGPAIATAATGVQQTIGQVQPIWDGLNSMGFHYHLNAQIIFGGLGVVAAGGILYAAYDLWKSHKALA